MTTEQLRVLIIENQTLRNDLEHSERLNTIYERKVKRLDDSDEILLQLAKKKSFFDVFRSSKLSNNEIDICESKLISVLDDVNGFPGEPTLVDLVDAVVYKLNKINDGLLK